MPIFNHANNADASGSNFYDGHTIINNYSSVVHFSLFSLGPMSRRSCNSTPNPSHITCDVDVAAEECVSIKTSRYHYSNTALNIDVAIAATVQITSLLVDSRNSSNSHHTLKLELESLYQILDLTKGAIREYEDRPLGQSLVNTIAPEVERCHVLLLALLAKVNDTWVGLILTSISHLWRLVWRRQWDGDELASLKRRLSRSRNSLGGFLMALNSYVSLRLCLSSHAETPPNYVNCAASHGSNLAMNYVLVMYPFTDFTIC